MNAFTMVGSILLALGLAGVIWGIVEVHDDRDVVDMGDVQVILDEGDFPPLGIAGAVATGAGLFLIGAGALIAKRS